MKKLFISLPMDGKDRSEIETDMMYYLADAEKRVGEELQLIEFLFEPKEIVSHSSLYYLGKSLELLSEADYVYFGEGWKEARGCSIEHECAVKYNISILED